MRKPILFLFAIITCLAASAQYDSGEVVTTIQETVTVEQRGTKGFSIPSPEAPVAVRKLPADEVSKLKASEEYWYANAEREKRNPKAVAKEEAKAPSWLRGLAWFLVVAAFLAVVVWYLISSNIRLFGRSGKKIASGEEGDGDTEDIFALPYEREIAKAEDEGAYRQAVRLRYLQTLRELSDRGMIDYRFGRTNSYYVSQLRSHPQGKAFSGLTRAFEYIWYGQFPLSAERYHAVRTDFTRFKSALG